MPPRQISPSAEGLNSAQAQPLASQSKVRVRVRAVGEGQASAKPGPRPSGPASVHRGTHTDVTETAFGHRWLGMAQATSRSQTGSIPETGLRRSFLSSPSRAGPELGPGHPSQLNSPEAGPPWGEGTGSPQGLRPPRYPRHPLRLRAGWDGKTGSESSVPFTRARTLGCGPLAGGKTARPCSFWWPANSSVQMSPTGVAPT